MYKIIKKILDYPPIKTSVLSHYSGSDVFTKKHLNAAFVQDNAWLFSQMKSGTTLLCNTLAFYNAVVFRIPEVSFDSVAKAGILRGSDDYGSLLLDIQRFILKSQAKFLVHTHDYLPGCRTPLLIITTRNPYDYAVSSYYFHYKNRLGLENMSVEKAIPKIIKRFVATYHQQIEAVRHADNFVALSYEYIVQETYEACAMCIAKLYGTVDGKALNEALYRSSVESLSNFETEKGHAMIAKRDSFKKRHFVRSGKVGEGKQFFSDEQMRLITKLLLEGNVALDGKLPDK